MDGRAWRRHFEQNLTRDRADPRRAAEGIPVDLHEVLASTLARMQVGETGEGRIVNQVRRHGLGDADYHEAMRLFVAEEGQHAALLGRALRALGGVPLSDHWTSSTFTWGRGLAGPRAKLLVLLAAEVIAVCFYRALADALPEGPLADLLRGIHQDEVAHLEFHISFFRSEASSRRHQAAFATAWWPLSLACCGTVLLDHANTLAALGIERATLLREMTRTIAHVDARVRADGRPGLHLDSRS